MSLFGLRERFSGKQKVVLLLGSEHVYGKQHVRLLIFADPSFLAHLTHETLNF